MRRRNTIPIPQVHYRLGFAAREGSDLPEAIRELQESASLEQFLRDRVCTGAIALKQGDKAEADAACKRLRDQIGGARSHAVARAKTDQKSTIHVYSRSVKDFVSVITPASRSTGCNDNSARIWHSAAFPRRFR